MGRWHDVWLAGHEAAGHESGDEGSQQMMPTGSRRSRAARMLLPSSARRLWERRDLRRRHGLDDLGPDFDYWISHSSSFEPGCRLGGPCYIAGSTLGRGTYVEIGTRISAADIGRWCSIAPYSLVGLAEHPTRNFVSTSPAFYRHAPENGWDLVDEDRHRELRRTTIGSDVWIGAGACVRGGLTIGHGAVIGAGAVVTRDVDPYEIVGGIPARHLRSRFDDSTIATLLALAWWDRDPSWIRTHAHLFDDVDRLLAASADVRA